MSQKGLTPSYLVGFRNLLRNVISYTLDLGSSCIAIQIQMLNKWALNTSTIRNVIFSEIRKLALDLIN